jgi:hypothetical protein
MTIGMLEEEYGLGSEALRRIVLRKSWKWVPLVAGEVKPTHQLGAEESLRRVLEDLEVNKSTVEEMEMKRIFEGPRVTAVMMTYRTQREYDLMVKAGQNVDHVIVDEKAMFGRLPDDVKGALGGFTQNFEDAPIGIVQVDELNRKE